MAISSAKMTPSAVWLVLLAVGVLLPLVAFAPWVIEQGPNASLFLKEAFANRIAAFFTLDLIVSALTLLIAAWAFLEKKKAVLVSLLCLGIGVSAGLPLFLFFLATSRP